MVSNFRNKGRFFCYAFPAVVLCFTSVNSLVKDIIWKELWLKQKTNKKSYLTWIPRLDAYTFVSSHPTPTRPFLFKGVGKSDGSDLQVEILMDKKVVFNCICATQKNCKVKEHLVSSKEPDYMDSNPSKPQRDARLLHTAAFCSQTSPCRKMFAYYVWFHRALERGGGGGGGDTSIIGTPKTLTPGCPALLPLHFLQRTSGFLLLCV